VYSNTTRLTLLNDAGNADAGYDALGRLTQLRHLGAGNIQIAGFRFGYGRENQKLFLESLESPRTYRKTMTRRTKITTRRKARIAGVSSN
jgi:hypothetical protein